MRLAVGLLLSTVLVSCTNVTEEVRVTIEKAFEESKDAELTPEQIEKFPYTALYASWYQSPRILMVLGYKEAPDDWHFITGSKETVVLRNGRIIRTQNLKQNLLAVSKLQADPLNCIMTQEPGCDTTWQRTYDFQFDEAVISRSVSSSFSVEGKERVDLPQGERELTKVVEKGRFLLSDTAFTNYFWLASDGHVVKSQQIVFPNKEFILLTQVKWVGRDNKGTR